MAIDEPLHRLRQQGHTVSSLYVRAGAEPLETRMYAVVDGMPLTLERIRALDEGRTTLAEIVRGIHRTPRQMCPTCGDTELVFSGTLLSAIDGATCLRYRCLGCRDLFSLAADGSLHRLWVEGLDEAQLA